MASFFDSFLSHLTHLKQNQLGHTAVGNNIVNAVNNVGDPLISAALSESTHGLVNITPVDGAPHTSTTAEALADTLNILAALKLAHTTPPPGK